eukprot:GHVT01088145.1.p1 GENE.GHVT01088145.1~~GHVT01088145.1.p1  ORF type:complete len:371 (+),score=29.32 GHVT01088145.1:1488-2600(+)
MVAPLKSFFFCSSEFDWCLVCYPHGVVNMSQVTLWRNGLLCHPSARGTQQLVLYYLYGTLAIVYRGCTYHLPVTIYFDPPYPACAPRCFLTPTGDMAIKPRHKHASETGRIYLPYLANWNPMDAKLGHLLALMASTFSEDPPLFSIRASSQSGLVPSSVRPSSSYGPSIHPPSPASSSSTSTNVAPHPSAIASSSAFPSISPPLSRREQLQRDVENLIKERWTPIVLPLARRTQRLNEIKVRLDARSLMIQNASKALSDSSARLDEGMAATAEATTAVQRSLAELKTQKEPDADSVAPADGLSKQIWELTCEERYREDLVGGYDLALSCKALKLEDVLKGLRENFRCLFMARQLKKKAVLAINQRASPFP